MKSWYGDEGLERGRFGSLFFLPFFSRRAEQPNAHPHPAHMHCIACVIVDAMFLFGTKGAFVHVCCFCVQCEPFFSSYVCNRASPGVLLLQE